MITPTAPLIRHGYRCECRAQSPATGNSPAVVNTYDTTDPTQAVRWMRRSMTTLLLAVDADARERITQWIDTDHANALKHLEGGQPCTVATGYADVRLQWTARPVGYLPLLPPPRTPVVTYAPLCTQAQRHTGPDTGRTELE